jgi:hypothetical protein
MTLSWQWNSVSFIPVSFTTDNWHILQLKDLYHVVVALKNVSGFKWDEDNGVNVNEDTLPVWNAYVEVSITFFLLISY